MAERPSARRPGGRGGARPPGRAKGRRSRPAPLTAKRRTPVWRQVEQHEAKRVRSRVKSRRKRGRRYGVVYDIDGPRVRLGILWFVANIAALFGGVPAIALLYGGTAVVASAQTALAWRARGPRPHRELAAAGAGLIVAAAAADTALAGIAVLVLVAGAVLTAQQSDGRRSWVVDAGYTIQCSLFAGLAAASVVLAARYELGSVVALVLLTASYETGDFIVGSGARNSLEGPLAGITAIVVMSFSISALGIPPFRFPAAFSFGAVAAVLCPAGQLAASAVLPAAAARAPALRRLDSLLVLGPVWAFAIGLYVTA